MIKKNNKSRFFYGRFLTTNCKIIQIKIRSMLFGGQCFPQRFLGGCRTRLPPCKHGTQGSEHPYAFVGMRCSVPSPHPATWKPARSLSPYHGSLPCRNSRLFLNVHSLFLLLQGLLLMALLHLISSLYPLMLRLLIFFPSKLCCF